MSFKRRRCLYVGDDDCRDSEIVSRGKRALRLFSPLNNFSN